MDPDSDVLAFMGAGLVTLLYIVALILFARKPSRGGMHRWALIAFSALILVTGLAVTQWVSFRAEKTRIDREIANVAAVVENAKLTAARLAEFRREVERKHAAVAALRALLPETLETESFLADVERLARERSVRIVSADTDTGRLDFRDQAVTRLVLEGDDESISLLRQDVLGLTRVVHWNDARGDVTLTSYAMEAYVAPFAELCRSTDAGSGSAVWFPPYRDALAKNREQLAELCQEYRRLEPIAVQIHMYQMVLAELEQRERIIEELR